RVTAAGQRFDHHPELCRRPHPGGSGSRRRARGAAVPPVASRSGGWRPPCLPTGRRPGGAGSHWTPGACPCGARDPRPAGLWGGRRVDGRGRAGWRPPLSSPARVRARWSRVMRVVRSFDEPPIAGPVLLTIGTFDGVHRGHRFLLEQARDRAAEHGFGLVIVTFDPSPAVVLRPGLRRYQLTTAERKLHLLGALNPAAIVQVPFTLELSRWSASQFMDALEARMDLRELWLGEDFHFGHGREGGVTMLVERARQSGFSLHI